MRQNQIGRPKKAETRKARTLRAYNDEWELAQRFAKLLMI